MNKMVKQVFLIYLVFSFSAFADESYIELQQAWEQGNYELEGDEREKFLKALLSEAESAKVNNPKSAAVYAWSGIIHSTYANAKGGMGALKFAKQAKKDLEKSIDLDSKALLGAASNTLGVLYFRVPGWPVAFGNDKKAKQYLDAAMALNPEGIDTNYWYAEYLHSKGESAKALELLNKAEQAKPRADRPLADKGRLREVAELRARINGSNE